MVADADTTGADAGATGADAGATETDAAELCSKQFVGFLVSSLFMSF